MNDSKADGVLQARRTAMDALGRREHSHQELFEKLRARGLGHTEIELALAGLEDDGLLSDQRFAEALTNSRVRRGKGPVRIRLDLEQRGVSDNLITQALDTAQVDWNELARRVLLKRFGETPPQTLKQRAKQHRFLQYRGFDAEQIRAAIGKMSS